MNTNTLAKHYDSLTPRERLPLIEAALKREDETESQRLMNSASRVSLRIPDYFGLFQTVQEACFMYMLEQQNLAACYWRAEGLLAIRYHFSETKRRGKIERKADKAAEVGEEFLLNTVRMIAYRIVVNANAWRQFCAELNIDGDQLLSYLPGREMLLDVEWAADTTAFDADGATAFLRCQGDESRQADTAETVLQSWREFLDARLKWWGTE